MRWQASICRSKYTTHTHIILRNYDTVFTTEKVVINQVYRIVANLWYSSNLQIIEPPQKFFPSMKIPTCQGNWWAAASLPPTIFGEKFEAGPILPHSSTKKKCLSGHEMLREREFFSSIIISSHHLQNKKSWLKRPTCDKNITFKQRSIIKRFRLSYASQLN